MTRDLAADGAYVAEPTGAPRGGLVLIHEIWGLVPHIRDVADRYAHEGYLVVAPDLLSDAGITPDVGAELAAAHLETDPELRLGAQARLREAMTMTRQPRFAAAAVAKLVAAVDVLDSRPGVGGRIAVTGFCFGGTYSFALAAADARVRVALPFYGIAPDDGEPAGIRGRVLAFYGGDDARVTDTLPATRARLEDAGVEFAAHVYPGARHAFFNDTNTAAYDADAATDAWRRALAFLEAHLDGADRDEALPSDRD